MHYHDHQQTFADMAATGNPCEPDEPAPACDEGIVQVLGAALIPGGNRAAGERRMPCGWGLQLLLDRLPDHEEREYTAIPRARGCTLYVSLLRGIAHFFLHDPRDESGYGGAVFTPRVNGETVKVRGPWSSSTTTVNATGLFPLLIHASATDEAESWKLGYTFRSLSGVTVDVARAAMAFLPGWKFNPPAVRPISASLASVSGEQLRAIEHPRESAELFTYTAGIPICPACDGRGFVPSKYGEPGAFTSPRSCEWLRTCRECKGGPFLGCAPVPGMRWQYREVIAP